MLVYWLPYSRPFPSVQNSLAMRLPNRNFIHVILCTPTLSYPLSSYYQLTLSSASPCPKRTSPNSLHLFLTLQHQHCFRDHQSPIQSVYSHPQQKHWTLHLYIQFIMAISKSCAPNHPQCTHNCIENICQTRHHSSSGALRTGTKVCQAVV